MLYKKSLAIAVDIPRKKKSKKNKKKGSEKYREKT